MVFNVNKTVITRIDKDRFPLTSGSFDLIGVEFTFDSSWDPFVKYLIVNINGKTYNTPLDSENKCMIPNESLEKPGLLKLGVLGIEGTKIMTSLWTDDMKVWPGAKDENEEV